MMNIEFAQNWAKTTEFVRKEIQLLAPLALSTIGLGQTGFLLANLNMGTARQGSTLLGMFACLLLVMLGWLSITALVLRPGISVKEALVLGFRKLPQLAAIFGWFAIAILLVSMPLLYMMQKAGFNPAQASANFRAIDLIILSPLMLMAMWLSVKSYFLVPTLIEEKGNWIQGLGKAWRLSRGQSGFILALLLSFILLGQVAQLVVALIASLLFQLVFGLLGLPEAVPILIALFSGVVGAIFATLATVLAAIFYREMAR